MGPNTVFPSHQEVNCSGLVHLDALHLSLQRVPRGRSGVGYVGPKKS